MDFAESKGHLKMSERAKLLLQLCGCRQRVSMKARGEELGSCLQRRDSRGIFRGIFRGICWKESIMRRSYWSVSLMGMLCPQDTAQDPQPWRITVSPAFAIRRNASRKEILVWWSSCDLAVMPSTLPPLGKSSLKGSFHPAEYWHIHQTCLTAPSHFYTNIVHSLLLAWPFLPLDHIRETEEHDWELILTAGVQ